MCYTHRCIRVRSSVDRATGSGPVGRGFESLRARLFKLTNYLTALTIYLSDINNFVIAQ
jgi:hypothetical protein